MESEMLLKFKELFEGQKQNLIYTKKICSEEFLLEKDEMLDETDMTSIELDQQMRMRLRSRESVFARKIDEALERIAKGTFGECEECGEGIDIRRLEARPTATHCVGCKEQAEHRENLHIDSTRAKTVGNARLRFA